MKLITTLITALLTGAVQSEPAAIKSGEHDNFSRLVLYTGKSQSWTLQRQDKLVSVDIKGWNSGFDTSKIFTMIPKSRVSNVTSSSGGITLSLECSCDVLVQPVDAVGLIVDVRDNPEVDRFTSPPDPARETWPEREELILRSRNDEVLSVFTKHLSESIARAETQGILLAVEPNTPREIATSGHSELVDTLRIRATSAAQRAANIRHDEAESRSICPPDSFGDIENWGTEESYSQQIGALRRSIVGEFDTLDKDRVVQLAKVYLYFAMGAEANAVFETFGQTGHQIEFMRVLGRLLDNPGIAEASYDLPQNECVGTQAIWAALLGVSREKLTETQVKRITEGFDRLPHHLKPVLGPKLISRLHAEGHMTGASVIRNSILQKSSDIVLSQPGAREFELLEPDELKKIIRRADANAPAAIVALLRHQISNDTPLDKKMRQVARSFVVQQNGDSIAVEIAALLAKDAVVRGDYSNAVDTALDSSFEAYASEILSFAASALVREEGNSNIAKFALQLGPQRASTHLDEKTIQELSAQLYAMGLAGLARSFQAAPPFVHQLDNVRAPPEIRNTVSTSATEESELTIEVAQELLEASKQMRESIRATLDGLSSTAAN